MVTHSNTNRAQRRVTSLIETNGLPLSQAATRQFSFFACSGREPLGISGTGFYKPDVLPVTNQQSENTEGNSKH